jgi:hypothetical protein
LNGACAFLLIYPETGEPRDSFDEIELWLDSSLAYFEGGSEEFPACADFAPEDMGEPDG